MLASNDNSFNLTDQSSMRTVVFHQIFVYFLIVILKPDPLVYQAENFTKECDFFAMTTYSDIIMPYFH